MSTRSYLDYEINYQYLFLLDYFKMARHGWTPFHKKVEWVTHCHPEQFSQEWKHNFNWITTFHLGIIPKFCFKHKMTWLSAQSSLFVSYQPTLFRVNTIFRLKTGKMLKRRQFILCPATQKVIGNLIQLIKKGGRGGTRRFDIQKQTSTICWNISYDEPTISSKGDDTTRMDDLQNDQNDYDLSLEENILKIKQTTMI